MRRAGITIKVYYYFIKGLAILLFTSRNTKHRCAMDTLLNDFSFRAPLDLNIFTFSLKIVKDSFRKMWFSTPENAILFFDKNSPNAIVAGSFRHEKLTKDDYLEEILNVAFNLFTIYENIHFAGNILGRIFISCIYVLGLIPFSLTLPFLSNRKSAVYSYFELIEIIAITDLFLKRKVNNVFTFRSYEKSSNFLAFVLTKYGITLTKICSPNPIKVHYKKVVADKFVFTAPFQK